MVVNSDPLYQLSYRGTRFQNQCPEIRIPPSAIAARRWRRVIAKPFCQCQNFVNMPLNGEARAMAKGKGLEAGAGIEPALRDLQSRALPLCYPAERARNRVASARQI